MEFKFNHYIFASGAQPPVMTGEIKIEVIRTPMYSFHVDRENWEKNEICNETELKKFVYKAEPAFQWKVCDSANDQEIRSRIISLLTHGELKREQERVETIVTLLPGSNFEYGYSSPHEEGYSSYSVDAEWNGSNGWDIEESHGGRDCDGEHGNISSYSVDVNGNSLDEERTEVYDQFAEASGY